MGVGESSTPWGDLAGETPEDADQRRSGRSAEASAKHVPVKTQPDWVLLFVFTAIMTIPFALVAWLMA